MAALREEGPFAFAFVVTLLDAGLRLGEALGLHWGDIRWGSGPTDPQRSLWITHNLPTHGEGIEAPKSGRARRVALSQRLWRTLRERYTAAFQPALDTLVFPGIDRNNFRSRPWRRACLRAGIGTRALKDLRDTYASNLFSWGIQLGYVSRQLGHGDVAVTARHYARWVGGDTYRPAELLLAGEVPADLLARLAPECALPGREVVQSARNSTRVAASPRG